MSEIKYTLKGVSLEQFATLFEPSSDNISLNLSIPIKTNYEERSFAVGVNIQYAEGDRTFMVAELFCHYEIEKKCWDHLSDNGSDDVVIPKKLMDTLVRISISSIRGAICVKTENTPFAKYFLPIVEFGSKDGSSDFVLRKDN